ncbi:MAG: type II 3-dehydroquinate dehydratase [Acidimicrobiia bacterium]
MKIFVLNGPNLNLLGTREPDIYGNTTIEELEKMCRVLADELGVELEFRQTNDEGQLVEWIQEAGKEADGIVINPAAFTHYSISVRDALQAAGKPLVEVHISNIFARELERHVSVVSDLARGVIVGFGVRGYLYALRALKEALEG